MSIYKENKLFVNKYKQCLESEIKLFVNYWDTTYRMDLKVSIPNKTDYSWIDMWVTPTMEKNVYIVETKKRLYFCVKLKDKSRELVTRSSNDTLQKDLEYLAAIFYGKSITDADLPNIKKFLSDKGVTSIDGVDVKDIDTYTFYWGDHVCSFLKGYKELKPIVSILETLKECPIEITRHPDVFKDITDNELVPVSFIEDDEVITFSGWAKSRRASNLYHREYLGTFSSYMKKRAKTTLKSTPFSYWCKYEPKSSIIQAVSGEHP